MDNGEYEDGYEKGWQDAKDEYMFDEDDFNHTWELGYDQGYKDALESSREPMLRKAIQQFHLMHHKGSYTFEKCWDEPCKNIRNRV